MILFFDIKDYYFELLKFLLKFPPAFKEVFYHTFSFQKCPTFAAKVMRATHAATRGSGNALCDACTKVFAKSGHRLFISGHALTCPAKPKIPNDLDAATVTPEGVTVAKYTTPAPSYQAHSQTFFFLRNYARVIGGKLTVKIEKRTMTVSNHRRNLRSGFKHRKT